MKTLQQQYLLIKEGKGNKEQFLKQARNLFPEFITVNNDYNTTVHILKSKSILSEAVGGIATINPTKPDWFKIFNTNLKEAVGVKNTKEYGDQNEFDKIDTEVQKTLDKANFDNKDEKNIDNVYGQSFLNGYYTEMKDPKNADKTVDELKQIVLKNMTKDVTYYNTKASFGVKDIGYTSEAPGAGIPKAPKGKFKSSGYGDMPKTKVVKEGKDEDKIARYEKYTYTLDDEKVTPDDINFYNNILGAELDGKVYKMGIPDENGNVELKSAKGKTGMYTESLNEFTKSMDFSSKDQKDWSAKKSKMYDVWANKSNELLDLKDDLKKAKSRNDKDEIKQINNKILQKQIAIKAAKEEFQKLSESLTEAKKSNVHTRIKDLEKQNEILALESKITALAEAIDELNQKVSLSESDDLAEMMDPKKINELKKDIKVLEKYKITCEKKLSKLGGKKAVVDNEEINENESENENPHNKYIIVNKKIVRKIGPQNGDKSYNIVYDDFSKETIPVSHGDWDKINDIYQKAKNGTGLKENTSSVGKNYPGTLTAEFDGEEQVLDGKELYDFLTTVLTVANNENDFVSKVEYGLTNDTSKLNDKDIESLKNWYNANKLDESYDYETQADLRGMADEEALSDAVKQAEKTSREEGVVQHVNQLPDGSYEVSDWYDADTTIFSFENGIEL